MPDDQNNQPQQGPLSFLDRYNQAYQAQQPQGLLGTLGEFFKGFSMGPQAYANYSKQRSLTHDLAQSAAAIPEVNQLPTARQNVALDELLKGNVGEFQTQLNQGRKENERAILSDQLSGLIKQYGDRLQDVDLAAVKAFANGGQPDEALKYLSSAVSRAKAETHQKLGAAAGASEETIKGIKESTPKGALDAAGLYSFLSNNPEAAKNLPAYFKGNQLLQAQTMLANVSKQTGMTPEQPGFLGAILDMGQKAAANVVNPITQNATSALPEALQPAAQRALRINVPSPAQDVVNAIPKANPAVQVGEAAKSAIGAERSNIVNVKKQQQNQNVFSKPVSKGTITVTTKDGQSQDLPDTPKNRAWAKQKGYSVK